MNDFLEYQKRLTGIDQLLTPQLVKEILLDSQESILLDSQESILSRLENPSQRLIVITFASTAALLRRIQGNRSDRPISIEFSTIEEGRRMNPQSQVLNNCNPETQFCVIIGTWLPFSLLGFDKDQVLTHTTTCLTLTSLVTTVPPKN